MLVGDDPVAAANAGVFSTASVKYSPSLGSGDRGIWLKRSGFLVVSVATLQA